MTVEESVSMYEFVSSYVRNANMYGAKKFEKVSYGQFKKDFIDLLGIDYLVAEDYLPYRISGEYDPSAVDLMIRKIYDGIQLPRRSTSGSAGYDFYAPVKISIKSPGSIVLPTGIKCEINEGWFLGMFPRSGSGFKYGVKLANTVGIIDSDYYNNANNEGHIMVKLVNESYVGESKEVTFNKEASFCQGVLIPYGITEDDFSDGVRKGGLGSTG